MILQPSLRSDLQNATAPERSPDAVALLISYKPSELVPTGPFRFFRTLRSLWPLRTFRSLRALNPLRPVWPIHLCRAGIVMPLLPTITRHLIGTVEPAQFATGIGPAVLAAVLTPIHLTIFASIDLTILLPHITRLGQTNIVPAPASAITTPARTAVG